ncbi:MULTISPECIES: ubiquitin-like domain-containing protein [unclassified Streptomyces]|uniref:ubiquitin-like domain-containing protein n=1 Tax=unclassified Streptomyces TaxID=2593676 RepID=UPI0025522EBE|nr:MULTISPECIES: ubiquitin-like domain-containing protein [unclassified Streptomyces]
MSNSQGSHRAARGRGRTAAAGTRGPATVVVPAPSPVPPHEELTLAAWPLRSATVVDLKAAPGLTAAGRAAQAPTLTAPLAPAPGGRAGTRRAARRRRVSVGPEQLRRLVPQALVVAFLAGGTTAFVAEDKAVTLDVDGEPRTLHTFADDVGELLAEQGVDAAAAAEVSPAPGTPIGDGDVVTVGGPRPVTLTLDGVRRRVWTSEHTVGAALRRLGVRADGAYLSVSRAAPIGRTGLTLDVRTERTVTVMADGREHTVRTNAATVREAVARAGVALHGEDTTSVAPESFPRDGQTVSVLRITTARVVREELLPYAVERTGDDGLPTGTEVVEREGRDGSRRVMYALRTVNGVRQKPRELATEVVREPVSRIVKAGTGPRTTGKLYVRPGARP